MRMVLLLLLLLVLLLAAAVATACARADALSRSWEACRAACCANPKCGTYTYVNGSEADNYKDCYLRDLKARITASPGT